MANRPAQLLVALSRRIENDGIAAFTVRYRQRVRAAKLQISNDWESGERRSTPEVIVVALECASHLQHARPKPTDRETIEGWPH